MSPVVRKAVIPAAGLGTRFLPASKAEPKEMVPVVDKPTIQYVVEEAVGAGLRDILIISGRGKGSIEDHFDRSFELEHHLEASGKTEALEQVRAIAEMADVHFIRQGEPRGLGHAVAMARPHVGDEPFAVMLGDDIYHRTRVLEDMVGVFDRRGQSVIALQEVPRDRISLYGSVRPDPVEDNLVRVLDIVEKPAPEEAPSTLAVVGRYVFTPRIFEALDQTVPGKGGEIQLTDAIGLLLGDEPVYGFTFEGGRYDIGHKLDYLRATVELALERDDLGPEFAAYLADLVRHRNLV
jgi:UTP--glucose-1-phosphate uridylyltransferase